MKLHFDNVDLSSRSGPNSFATRLLKELLRTGHEVVDSGPDADVSLVFIERSGNALAKKVVQRLDGIWFAPHEFRTKNVKIQQLYTTADAVVWQSEFDRGMTTEWWGQPKLGRVIHNGVELVKPNKTQTLESLKQQFEHVFVCSSNWHPQKRLRTNIELFTHLRNNGYSNSCLIVMGANPDCWVSSPNIFFTGSMDHNNCLMVYAMADWMIHLAWLDHCPNVVVEALSQKLPVICSSTGGVKELVQDYGVVLSEKTYNYELVNYDTPPVVDVTQVKTLPARHELGDHRNVNIESVATSYINYFTQLLGS